SAARGAGEWGGVGATLEYRERDHARRRLPAALGRETRQGRFCGFDRLGVRQRIGTALARVDRDGPQPERSRPRAEIQRWLVDAAGRLERIAAGDREYSTRVRRGGTGGIGTGEPGMTL